MEVGGQERPVSSLILLTDLLTTDVDKLGCTWTRPSSAATVSRAVEQPRTDLDSHNLATDQMLPEVSACPLRARSGRDDLPTPTDLKVCARRVLERGGSSAAPKCSNQTDLRLTLADLFHGSDLPGRPSPTSTDLVCIQKARGSSPLSSTGQRPNAILKASKLEPNQEPKSVLQSGFGDSCAP